MGGHQAGDWRDAVYRSCQRDGRQQDSAVQSLQTTASRAPSRSAREMLRPPALTGHAEELGVNGNWSARQRRDVNDAIQQPTAQLPPKQTVAGRILVSLKADQQYAALVEPRTSATTSDMSGETGAGIERRTPRSRDCLHTCHRTCSDVGVQTDLEIAHV